MDTQLLRRILHSQGHERLLSVQKESALPVGQKLREPQERLLPLPDALPDELRLLQLSLQILTDLPVLRIVQNRKIRPADREFRQLLLHGVCAEPIAFPLDADIRENIRRQLL